MEQITSLFLDISGTSYQGYLTASYDDLVAVFGEPNGFECDKTDAEWWLQTPAGIATIYNWKNGKNYLGYYGANVKDITHWHVGGHNSEVVDLIVTKILRKLQEKENKYIKTLYNAYLKGHITGRELLTLTKRYLCEKFQI